MFLKFGPFWISTVYNTIADIEVAENDRPLKFIYSNILKWTDEIRQSDLDVYVNE